jgi:mono-ADP-ribosyltransferase sirtuin 6
MSAGYANRLKEYPNKGKCGLPELPNTERSLKVKIKQLASLMEEASKIVILTGAGISTSAGIPDFRGPSGIWTLEKENRKQSKLNGKTNGKKRQQQEKTNTNKRQRCESSAVVMDFASAKPSMTHRAITALVNTHIVRHVVTQNVDGLHQKSGLSRHHLSVLHGCAFTEKCGDCETEHLRDYDVGGMSFQKTGRKCELCNGDLVDTLLDWEDPLPEEDFARATTECEQADLAICLGTSLRIEPAGSLPTYAKKYVIVNLQETPKDESAALVIRGKVDKVMQGVMEHFGMENWDETIQNGAPTIERLWKRPKTTVA